MSREVKAELTNMCMITNGTKVLVQNRPQHGSSWSGIVFPGGHIEPGESVVDSVIREVKEETGLLIEHPRLRGIKDWMRDDGSRYLVLLFSADTFSGELKPSEEGEVFWAERDALPGMNLARSIKETLEVLTNDALSEMYFTECARITEGDHWNLQ